MAGKVSGQSEDAGESLQGLTKKAPPIRTQSQGITTGDEFSESSRRDSEIAHSARGVLELKKYLPSEQVPGVAVKDGWVTLWGEVGRDYQRQPATRAVFRLQGVRGVTDLIAVSPATPVDLGGESP
jgi:osmotically-inducible protein OsmY